MLRLNRETDYAIRVILALAKRPLGEVTPSAVIRQEMLLPESLSLQIISHLAHLNLIKTYPGRNGGIQLAHPAAEITLYDVVHGLEGPLYLSECLEEGHQCQLAPGCPVQDYWKELRGKIEKELKGTNFQNLSETVPQGSTEQVK